MARAAWPWKPCPLASAGPPVEGALTELQPVPGKCSFLERTTHHRLHGTQHPGGRNPPESKIINHSNKVYLL